jgi:hypothetical protein
LSSDVAGVDSVFYFKWKNIDAEPEESFELKLALGSPAALGGPVRTTQRPATRPVCPRVSVLPAGVEGRNVR